MTGRKVLVLGGARSGKSTYAERLVSESGLERIYVATAREADAARDLEMTARIREHRERRGRDWRTVETPEALEETLQKEAGEGRAVLVDCLTLWLSNLMLGNADVALRTEGLCRTLGPLAGLVVLVSNEVGLGIVPDNAMARTFRDHAGHLNQEMARLAHAVYFIAAGLPLALKQG